MAATNAPDAQLFSSPKLTEMHDSELTSPTVTDTGSVSDEDRWFGIGADLKTFARSIKRTVPNAIDGIATAISKSAMAVAAEFSELERDAEQEARRWREENYGTIQDDECAGTLQLPWEINCDESSNDVVEDNVLKMKVLNLSRDENMFLKPFSVSSASGGDRDADGFVLDEARIDLIRRLLEIDENLATVHARLSGRSDVKETVFWKNYFHHCERLRKEHWITSSSGLSKAAASGSSLGSLTAAQSCEEDASFVIPSPPTSMNSIFSTHSVGDMVLVGGMDALDTHDEHEEYGD